MLHLIILFFLIVFILTLWFNLTHGQVSWSTKNIDWHQFDFPAEFKWGVATAAHQVEGGCHNNDWALWEKSYDLQGQPHIKGGQKAGQAADHWQRYKEDIQLIKDLGCNTYRFSLEWSKIEPQKGQWDQKVLAHYQDVCQCLHDHDITPFVTLHHFTSPIWIDERGGFEHFDTVRYFNEYVAKVAETLGGLVDFWGTINEPNIYALQGWQNGCFPPGKQDTDLMVRVLSNLLKAHAEAYHTLHRIDCRDADHDGISCQVGLIKSVRMVDPWRRYYLPDWYMTRIVDGNFNQEILNALQTGVLKCHNWKGRHYSEKYPRWQDTLDWIGVNYYTRELVQFTWKKRHHYRLRFNPQLPKTQMGWDMYPAGLYRALKRVHSLGVPVYITENGLASDDQHLREDYILQHLDALHEALQDGVDVRGYLHWSLMDNFEWAFGFDKHFGLYQVNPQTFARQLKPGSHIYQQFLTYHNRKYQSK